MGLWTGTKYTYGEMWDAVPGRMDGAYGPMIFGISTGLAAVVMALLHISTASPFFLVSSALFGVISAPLLIVYRSAMWNIGRFIDNDEDSKKRIEYYKSKRK